MGIFRRMIGRGLGTSSVSFDPCLGDEEIQQVVKRLSRGDWKFAEEVLSKRVDSWLIVGVLVADESPVKLSTFETWNKESGSAISLSLLGMAQTRAAWEIRGRAYANEVDKSAWVGFFGGLEAAEATLHAAVYLDPTSAEPWVGLMTTARGLQLGRDELRERFDNAHAREPFRPDACATMLQGLCKKWSGSHEEMFAFARWIEADAAPDSAARVLLHLAHFEFVAAKGDEGLFPSTYFAQPEVAAELVPSAEAFLSACPDEIEARHLGPLNMFVMTIVPTGPRSVVVLRHSIDRIAGRPTPTPWNYYVGDIGKRYQAVVKERLAACRQF